MTPQKNTLPKYLQIAHKLKVDIQTGKLVKGERLASERELSKMFNVTRVTLRKAIQRLVSEGFIESKHGSGNYIAESQLSAPHFTPIKTDLHSALPITEKLLILQKKQVKDSIATLLQLPAASEVLWGHRLRFLHGQPIVIEKFYLPTSIFIHQDLTLFDTAYQQHRKTVQQMEQSIEAIPASEYEADLLQVDTGTPLLLERQTAFNQDNLPIEYIKTLYRGDKFKFLMKSNVE